MQEDLSNKTEPTRIESLQFNSSVTSSSSKKLTMEKEMVVLYQSIDLLLPALPKRVIQFIASRPGEGTSTIARQFASIAVTKFNKSVLILELNDNHEAIYKITNSNSSISFNLIYQQDTMVNASIVKKHIDNGKVDLIVIDSESAATSSHQWLAVSAIVDGVVLVVEAENTRWQVIDNLKHNIMKNKGNILGIVFNKRRFYIPDFIYRRF